ncbi:beta-galactosidase [Sphingobacterium sp. NGMCC 1.201703]|uniref:beta-galactosidase n=1 Tax=Sphingobacterium sp. NGMCC 1.201703 TaxID=3388657 RepID=UPI0039FDD742
MKYSCIALACLLYATAVHGQYEMNLKNAGKVPLSYLNKVGIGPKGKEIRINNIYMEEGGKPVLPVMGEFHYVRMDHRYWRDALLKMKASGINMVATYVMWSLHEETEGKQNWSGNYDLRRFVELCAELDLKVHLRAGPYCNAEMQHGALPEWIVNNKALVIRSNDPLYLNYSKKWYQSVYKQVRGLLYKDGGPIVALQLENEFVKKGLVVSHLMNLKKLARDAGFDVPLYTMTHWMDSEYPKGEVVPYGGFYIETPWVTNNGKITPPTNFEYFTYNRLSDNIGTDIIKVEGNVESFDGSKNDSPFFTCEVGVGAPTFYHRRAVVPEEMAGENINLRLGTGVNLMGYYMYVGGTNPRGEKNTYGNGPYFGYDYQAPIREFGTLGGVMKETKKLNYFINDFGTQLAPMLAYLPLSNKNKDNLQWAVRSDGKSGFLFVSNYLYRYDRPTYEKVQFKLQLRDEELAFPRKPVDIVNKSYFLWPFNLDMAGVNLKYGTVQPITSHREGKITSYFFFEDDGISAEYLIDALGIKTIHGQGAKVSKEKNRYFVSGIVAGKESVITITRNNGEQVKLVTLTEKQSDDFWKGKHGQKDFVALTSSSLTVDDNKILITGDEASQQISLYRPLKLKAFENKLYQGQKLAQLQAAVTVLGPMDQASWIHTKTGTVLKKTFDGTSLANVSEATLRFSSDKDVKLRWNGKEVSAKSVGEYAKADVKAHILSGSNEIRFESEGNDANLIASVEILYKNGVRKVWNTDDTWLNEENKPVGANGGKAKPAHYSAEERLGLFVFDLPDLMQFKDDVRLQLSYFGDKATAYIGNEPFTDTYNNGAPWLLGVSRKKEELNTNKLIVRITGFGADTQNIFLEDNVDRIKSQYPAIKTVNILKNYTYIVD